MRSAITGVRARRLSCCRSWRRRRQRRSWRLQPLASATTARFIGTRPSRRCVCLQARPRLGTREGRSGRQLPLTAPRAAPARRCCCRRARTGRHTRCCRAAWPWQPRRRGRATSPSSTWPRLLPPPPCLCCTRARPATQPPRVLAACRAGHVCIIPETRDFFIAYGAHPEWGTAHTVWGQLEEWYAGLSPLQRCREERSILTTPLAPLRRYAAELIIAQDYKNFTHPDFGEWRGLRGARCRRSSGAEASALLMGRVEHMNRRDGDADDDERSEVWHPARGAGLEPAVTPPLWNQKS